MTQASTSKMDLTQLMEDKMACEVCRNFPSQTSHEEVDFNKDRQATLFRCRACGSFFEMIEEERSVRFTPMEELREYYPNLKD